MKTKRFVLSLVALCLAFILNAQDKYEFMSIQYQSNSSICVSIDGKELFCDEIKLPKTEANAMNVNPLLLKAKEYQNQGWEVMSLNTAVAGSSYGSSFFHFAYLRKKKS
jgi:hypothetical protein